MSYKNVSSVGKVTIYTVLLGFVVILLAFITDSHNLGHFQIATATSTITTSVTVLNTPPIWNGSTAEETPASSVSVPTNSGNVISWITTAKDNNGEDYFLLICKTSTAAVPHSNAKPTCDTVANQWAVSATTTSETQATAATTTTEAMPGSNAWFGFICDANISNPKCNTTFDQGTGNSGSPFIVNHRPSFTAFSDNTPVNPGATVTWSTTASDPEGTEPDDTIDLYVCQTNSFATTTRTCTGGEWCHSTPTLTSLTDPTCSFTLTPPNPDRNYASYGFVVDEHNHGALYTGGNVQGTNSVLTVNNVTPTISAASITLTNGNDTQPLILTTANGQTTGFKAKFTVTDNNSCIANSSTTPEITSATINVYRSSVTQAGCDASGEFNTNQCYTDAASAVLWQPTCTQDASTCFGEGDSTAAWTCTFPLWFNADPTGTNTQYLTDKWYVSAQAYDKNFATSTSIEIQDASAPLLQSLLAYNVPAPAVAYDALEPGFDSGTLNKTVSLLEWGNVGLDEVLYGDDMCTTYPSCTVDATKTVFAPNQQFATSSLAYGLGVSLNTSSVGQDFLIHILKTTSTTTPETKSTYWGIAIPSAITLAGNYTGQNYLAGKVANPVYW